MKLNTLTPFAAALAMSLSVAHAEGTPAPVSPVAGETKTSGEGMCGGMKSGMAEGKCGGMKSVVEGGKAAKEGKCGEGKCGADKMKAKHKPEGEGKAENGMMKDKPKAMKEGKCGEGKCGGKKPAVVK